MTESAQSPRIQMRGIHKNFGAVSVLNSVDLSVDPGEVIGLVGDNGAGKSTLMKILAGAVKPSAGELLIDGESVELKGPKQARELGIEMVYQDLALCDHLDVASNVFLGREPVHRFTRKLNRVKMHEAARRHLNQLHIRIPDLSEPVASLSGGQRQAVAIARAATFEPRILVLDEPTASLAAGEVALVLELVKEISAKGVSVIFITHRLQDLYEVTDSLAVLYEGRILTEVPPSEMTMDRLIRAMVGDLT